MSILKSQHANGGEYKRIAVEMKGIVKRFPGIVANDNIDLTVYEGEVHGLLGENGAGKTTLMNILYGQLKLDSGEIYLWGERVSSWSPKKALQRGIVMVAQHFRLIPRLTVLENIMLGVIGSGKRISRHQLSVKVKEIEERYGLKVNLDNYVWQLTAGEKQRVELIRALVMDARLIILDEPTTVLTPIESKTLFKILRKLAGEKKTIIFITHKLWEALEACDRITVLRKGRKVGTLDRESASQEVLTHMMFGQAIEDIALYRNSHRKSCESDKAVLSVRDLWVKSDKGYWAVRGVGFEVYRCEVLGIVGIAGNGQEELVEAIVGLRKKERGVIVKDGLDITNLSVRELILRGISYVPEDRLERGVARGLSVAENLALKSYWKPPFARKHLVNWEQIHRHAEVLVGRFQIKAPGVKAPVETLSGGNIQRLILARELTVGPQLLVAHNPTFGLDLKSTIEFHKEILALVERGGSVILVTEELEEALALSNRIAVMFDGMMLGPFKRDEVNRELIGYLMTTGRLPERKKVKLAVPDRSRES
uniref:ABC transporter ATP-binding protein n=1 Tax=Fervidicoccus fontis TaxID=683846 RepID=A0A7J3ZJP8_9CREN